MKYILNEEEYSNYINSIEENKNIKKDIDQIKKNVIDNIECHNKDQYYCDNCIFSGTGNLLINNFCLIGRYKNYSK